MAQTALERLRERAKASKGDAARDRLKARAKAAASPSAPTFGEHVQGFVSDVGRGLGHGLVQGVAVPARIGLSAAEMFAPKGSQPVDVDAAIAEGKARATAKIDAMFPIPESVAAQEPGFVSALGHGLGSTLQAGATMALSPSAGVAMIVGGGVLQGHDDAKAAGADDSTAWTAGLLNAPGAALDVIPGGAVARLAKLGKAGRAIAKADKASGGKFTEFFRGRWSTPVVEGLTEGGQDAWKNLVDKYTYDKDRELLQGAGMSTLVGTIIGGGVAVADRVVAGPTPTDPAPPAAQPQPGTSPNPPSLDPSTGETAAATTDQAPPSDTVPLQPGLDVGGAAVPALPQEAEPAKTLYHGSPHAFDEFSAEKIGTGEGAQSFGHGLYFTDKKEIAEHYQKKLSSPSRTLFEKARDTYEEHDSPGDATDAFMARTDFQPLESELLGALQHDGWLGFDYPHQAVKAALGGNLENYDPSPALRDVVDRIKATPLGNLYTVSLAPKDSELLHWDRPLSEQSEPVRSALAAMGLGDQATGQSAYRALEKVFGPKGASKKLADAGVRGIKYLAGTSRAKGSGDSNYVVFDPADVAIVDPAAQPQREASYFPWEEAPPSPDAPVEELVKRQDVRDRLRDMAAEAGQAETGGLSSRDDEGGVIGRTSWGANSEWWGDRPKGVTKKYLQDLVKRATSEEPGTFTEKQAALLDWMIHRRPTSAGPVSLDLDEPGATADAEAIAAPPPPSDPAVTSESADIPGFEIPDETRAQNLRQRYVNDFERQNVLEEAAPNKVEGEQVSSLYRRMSGKIVDLGRVLHKTVWEPTKREMAKFGVDPLVSKPGKPSLEAYSTAIGGPERNETMMQRSIAAKEKAREGRLGPALAKIVNREGEAAITSPVMESVILRHEGDRAAPTPEFDHETNPGSGMKTSEAKRIVAEAENGPAAPFYLAIKERVARMNEQRLTREVEKGRQTQKWADDVRKAFGQYFSPMQTIDETDKYFAGPGGINVDGSPYKRATGRTSQAFIPFVQNLVSAEMSFAGTEQNVVAQKFAEWIKKNPALGRVVDSLEGVTNDERKAGRVVGFREGGQQRYMVLADQRLADSARLLEASKIDDTLRSLDKALNWLRSVNTSKNPVFWISNFPRDVGMAVLKMGTDESIGFAADVMKTVPRAVRAMRRVQANENAPGALEDTFRLVAPEGGFTSKADLASMQGRLEEIQKELNAGVTRKAAMRVGQYFLDLNNAFEYATRLAVAHVALERGKTVPEAVLAARSSTGDFLRKGEKSAFWNRVYIFFGANVQGTASVVESFAKHPQRGATAAGLLIGMGYVFAVMSRGLADEDDDGISKWEKIPDYDKSRRLGIMLGSKMYGVPAPWGFGFFSGLGTELEAMFRGGQSFETTASKVVASLLDNTSPLPAGSPLMQPIPTILRPGAELLANENFAGSPIMPERNPFEAASLQPDAERHFKNVNPQLASIFSSLNRATGGDTMRAGAVDVSPETAEHMLGWIGGGLGRFAGRTFNLAGKMIRSDPIYTSDWPGLRTFMSEVPEFDTSRRYYDNLRAIEAAHARAMARSGMSDDDRFYLRFDKAAREIDKRVTLLRKAGRPDEEIDAVRKKLNGMVNTAKEQM